MAIRTRVPHKRVNIYPQGSTKVAMTAGSVVRKLRDLDDVGEIADGLLMYSSESDQFMTANVINGGSY